MSSHVATWLKVLDRSRANWCFSALFRFHSSMCHFHSQSIVESKKPCCAWLKCKVQCLKCGEFVRIRSRYSLCPSVLLSLTSFSLFPLCDEWAMKSTAYAALLMNYWTVESGRDGVLHAVHTEEPLCERMTDVKKKNKWLQASLCQCTKTLLTVKNICKYTLAAL